MMSHAAVSVPNTNPFVESFGGCSNRKGRRYSFSWSSTLLSFGDGTLEGRGDGDETVWMRSLVVSCFPLL